VTTYGVNPDGTPRFLSKRVIGSTPSTSQPVPGTNAYGIDVTPSGRFVAVSHATSASQFEQLTILRVAGDGSTTIFHVGQTPDSPLDLLWVSDTVLAVTLTNSTPNVENKVIMYRWDETVPSLTEIDRETTGGFGAYLALHPSRRFLFADDSDFNSITSFRVNADGTLDNVGVFFAPTFCLGPGVTPDGRFLFAGGGISSGSNKIPAFEVDQTSGALSFIGGAPFVSPGQSPKQVIGSPDSRFALVGHGTDATIRVFAIDQSTGTLTSLGFGYDIGFQGSLGETQFLNGFAYATDRDTISDGVRGLQALRLEPNGELRPVGTRVDSQGVSPNQMAVWSPPAPTCRPDLNNDGELTFDDITIFVGLYNANDPRADFNSDQEWTFDDIALFVGAYNAGC
jgi:hypothetical protein